MSSLKTATSYQLDKSPLYGVRGKGQFERALGVSWAQTEKLLKPRYYRQWTTAKDRLIQQPLFELKAVHNRIAALLSRIELPDYVYSQKYRSHLDNAEQHRGLVPLIKTDVNGFFQSISRPMVYRMLQERFACAKDIAARLADICCFEQRHLPTGSSLSGYVAFFAAQPLFDQLAKTCHDRGCKMTLYVDDLTVSGGSANPELLLALRSAIRYFGLRTRDGKSMAFREQQPKPVTGAIVIGERLALPNKHHLRLWEAKRAFTSTPAAGRPALARTIIGRELHAQQILARQEHSQ